MHTILPEPLSVTEKLSPLATDPPCQLNVLGHDGHALRVDGTQISVFEETNQVGLSCLLQSKHRVALEAQIRLHGSSGKSSKNTLSNKLYKPSIEPIYSINVGM